MEANKIFNSALNLLGYDTSNIPERLKSVAVDNINIIYQDLWRIEHEGDFTPIRSLSDRLDLSPNVLSGAMIYGVCSRLAQSESDGDQQQTFVMLFNAERAKMTQVKHGHDLFSHHRWDLL